MAENKPAKVGDTFDLTLERVPFYSHDGGGKTTKKKVKVYKIEPDGALLVGCGKGKRYKAFRLNLDTYRLDGWRIRYDVLDYSIV